MESIGITGNNPVLSRTFSWLYENTAGNYYQQLQRYLNVLFYKILIKVKFF